MESMKENSLFTNVALTADGDVAWWEGLTPEPPSELIDWKGQDWTPETGTPAAHPNARLPLLQLNAQPLTKTGKNQRGSLYRLLYLVVAGCRTSAGSPTFNWNHGVYLGATLASETTAAAEGSLGNLRRDPMAMIPFCGYNGDYFRHWIKMGKELKQKLRIFHVNWFRKDEEGNFYGPVFG